MAKCKNCGEGDKTWLQGENGKWQLLNADGSRHYCMGGGSGTAGGGGSSQPQPQQQQQTQQWHREVPIAQAQQQHQQQQVNDKLQEQIRKIEEQIERQAIFYEGLVGEMQTISRSVHKAFLIADKVDQFMQQAKITDAKIDRLVARFARENELARQEEEYDRDKEEGTIGFG